MAEASFPDLRAFLAQLRRDGDLAVVEAPVDARLEAAEIHRRVIAAGGPALLFTGVRGAEMPLATNLFGTARRAELAFGKRPFQLVRRLVELAETLLPPSPRKLWGARGLAREALRIGLDRRPRRRAGTVMEEVTRDVRLDRLPVLTTWPEDGGPFITLPLVYTEHPAGHGRKGHNLGMYRLQVHDPRTTGMHWQIGKGGGFHHAAAEARGESLPVDVWLGGPPALILAAVAPLPENVPELMLASLIAGRRLPLMPGPGGRAVPAFAELALSGRVPAGVRRPEGPFGDHYGYYSLRHDYPVFEVEWLARRRDAIYPATVVGKPRQEDFFLGDLLQELLSPLFPLVMPAVEALWSYGETGYHSLAATVVKQRYAREAMASAFRILGEGQLSLTKFLLVTDRAVDLKDFRATLTHLLERTRPEVDLYVFANLAMDTLDYTGPRVNEGSKGVWLGLGDPVRELPRTFAPVRGELPPGLRDALVFSPGCLVLGGPPFAEEPGAAARFAAHPAFAGWPLLVLTDEPRRAAASPINFLWTTFTRFEPAADVHAAAVTVVRNHLAYRPPVLIDARLKPGFPDELRADPDTAALVSRRWREYFPSGGVEMGDSDAAHLDRS
ncbi:MAG: UbiD family decarboxylase [Acidobacteria bacterium]|nr:UbiD family decarboxylase [Acidobacteriota bacterium]